MKLSELSQAYSVSIPVRRFLRRALVMLGFFVLLAAPPFRANWVLASMGTEAKIFAPLWAGVTIFFLCSPRAWLHALRTDKFFLALVAVALLSNAWTDSPATTRSSSFELASLLLLSGAAVGAFGGAERAIRAMGWLLLALCMLSWMVAFWTPGVAWDKIGQLRGIFYHKSQLGVCAAMAVLILSFEPFRRRGSRAWPLVSLACVPLLALSRSASAVVGLLAALAARRVASGGSPSRARFFVATAVLGLVLALAVNRDRLISSSTKYLLTLNGRVQKWNAVITGVRWENRPAAEQARAHLLGAGYDAFWMNRKRSRPVLRSARLSTSDPKQYFTDNGILDAFASFGAVGLVLLLASIGVNALRALRRRHDPYTLWAVAFLAFCLAFNMLYTGFLDTRSPLLPLYVMTSIGLSGRRREC